MTKGENMKLTETQILEILKNNRIRECTKQEKAQVMAYAFGEEFMASDDKGSIKEVRAS
tara:strand:- start:557 stop:733 length:177 start_codon:yes stop_codon:yes gene_type:complete